jgi:hypothetical protein
MPTSGGIVRNAFNNWMSGTGYVASISPPDMKREIVGHSAVSAKYSTAQEFQDEVLTPCAQRFSTDDPFRSVKISGFLRRRRYRHRDLGWGGDHCR